MEKWKCCYYFCKRLLRTSCWGWYSVEASVISTNALHSCLPRMVAIKKSHNKSYCFFILWNEATDDLRVMSNLKFKSSMLDHLLCVFLKLGCKHAKRRKVRLYSEVICGHSFEDYEVGVRGWSLEGKWGHQRRPFFLFSYSSLGSTHHHRSHEIAHFCGTKGTIYWWTKVEIGFWSIQSFLYNIPDQPAKFFLATVEALLVFFSLTIFFLSIIFFTFKQHVCFKEWLAETLRSPLF